MSSNDNLLKVIERIGENLGPPVEETQLDMKRRLTDFCYPLLAMPPPEVAKLRDFLVREMSKTNVMIARLVMVSHEQQVEIMALRARTVSGRLSSVGRAFSDAWASTRDLAGHLFSPAPPQVERPEGDDKVAMVAAPAERPRVVTGG